MERWRHLCHTSHDYCFERTLKCPPHYPQSAFCYKKEKRKLNGLFSVYHSPLSINMDMHEPRRTIIKRREEMENSYECSKKDKDVSLQELRDRLAEFAQVRGWDQFHSPRNLLLALVGEVGELSEIFQWKGEVARGLPNWTPDDKEHLEEEISDVLLYLIQLADVCGLDLGQAALTKIIKNAKKYPVVTQTTSATNY